MIRIVLALFFLLVSCAPARELVTEGGVDRCTLPANFDLIPVEASAEGEQHRIYTLRDVAALWEPVDLLPEVAVYKSSISQRFGTLPDWRELLARQHAIYANVYPGEAHNSQALLDGRVGTHTVATCIEQLLWSEQARRWSMLSHPTEMSAFILRQHGMVHVYFRRQVATVRRCAAKCSSE